MAKLPEADPFDEADGAPLSVSPGSFEGGPAGDDGVAGWDTTPKAKPQRRGLYVAIALIVLMALVIPLGVGYFANMRREYLAEQAATGVMPTVVELSAEVQAVQDQLDPIQAAFIMSNGIAEEGVAAEMSTRIDDTTTAILANDVGRAQSSFDDVVAYFTATYSQMLPDRATMILENYPYSNYETDARIEELKATILANAMGQDLSALVAAVIELPQRVGDAMSEHLGNRVTWVPPTETGTPEPTPDPTATGGPGPTIAPGTSAGIGNSNQGANGDDDGANANANANANGGAEGNDDGGVDGNQDVDPDGTTSSPEGGWSYGGGGKN